MPDEIATKAVGAGIKKANLSIPKMILLGMFAGAFIALAGVGATFGNAYAGKIAGAHRRRPNFPGRTRNGGSSGKRTIYRKLFNGYGAS